MTITQDFEQYREGNGLFSCWPNPTHTSKTCDNGPMFASEVVLAKLHNNALDLQSMLQYIISIKACINTREHLQRAPEASGNDEIDDHLGVLSAFADLNVKASFKLPLALYRFPQLVYAWLLNKGVPSPLMFPLTFITALIIGTSCINHQSNDTDARRLNWHLINATKKHSFLCYLAGKFWAYRQSKVYGSKDFMKIVAGMYYNPNGLDQNPYSKYWIT